LSNSDIINADQGIKVNHHHIHYTYRPKANFLMTACLIAIAPSDSQTHLIILRWRRVNIWDHVH